MKRNKFFAIIVIAIMMLGGCGNSAKESINTETSAEINESSVEQEPVESSAPKETDAPKETAPESTMHPEEEKDEYFMPEEAPENFGELFVSKTDDELNLTEYDYSYEDRSLDGFEGEPAINTNWFYREDNIPYKTTAPVSLYNVNGVRIGYTKEGAYFESIGYYGGWMYFYLDGNLRFADAEEVISNTETTCENTGKDGIEELPAWLFESPEPMVYDLTADEAISMYKEILEASGMSEDESLKEYMSDFVSSLPLNKAEVERIGNEEAEIAKYGNLAGAWKHYYIEVTGSDDEYVYFRSFMCE